MSRRCALQIYILLTYLLTYLFVNTAGRKTFEQRADEVDGDASAALEHGQLDVLTERMERLVQPVGDLLSGVLCQRLARMRHNLSFDVV